MKLATLFVIATSLALIRNAHAADYGALAAQGYRWVIVNGPDACTSEQDVYRLVANRTDSTELEVVQSIQCYYLIRGTIVQVIQEDPTRGITEIHLAGVTRYLWTYTRFLSKRPIRDTYGVIETPSNSGLSRPPTLHRSQHSHPIARRLRLGRKEIRKFETSNPHTLFPRINKLTLTIMRDSYTNKVGLSPTGSANTG